MAAKRKSWLGEFWRPLAALLLWAVGIVAAHAAPPLLPSLAETRVGGLQPSAEIIAPADLLLSLELHRACGPPLYDVASDCSVAAKSGVRPYEVGRFDDLKGRSLAGDGLDIHHGPQKHAAGQVVPGYDPRTAPSMAVPAAEHQAIPTVKGPYPGTPRQLLSETINDLRANTNAPNSAIRELIESNRQAFPGAFNKP